MREKRERMRESRKWRRVKGGKKREIKKNNEKTK